MSKLTTLRIAYFYPDHLNLYGDNGNIEILAYRAKQRGIDVEIKRYSLEDTLDDTFVENTNILFMGGGPDSSQKSVYKDLLENKAPFVKKYIEGGGVSLLICGSYQLMGKYYKTSDGTMVDGLGIFDLYTEHPGPSFPRCIGNMRCELNKDGFDMNFFDQENPLGLDLVGFENHGGRTYLGPNIKPFAFVQKGFGNNGNDGTEGAVYKNSIGTYSHGPILSKNPHLADYLIFKGLEKSDPTIKSTIENLAKTVKIDDSLVISAHISAQKLAK